MAVKRRERGRESKGAEKLVETVRRRVQTLSVDEGPQIDQFVALKKADLAAELMVVEEEYEETGLMVIIFKLEVRRIKTLDFRNTLEGIREVIQEHPYITSSRGNNNGDYGYTKQEQIQIGVGIEGVEFKNTFLVVREWKLDIIQGDTFLKRFKAVIDSASDRVRLIEVVYH